MPPDGTTIKVDGDVQLAEVLDAARSRPVRLEKDGVTYTLTRDNGDIWADYDPKKALSGMNSVVGAITPEQADQLKERIYRAREEGTRPADRP